MCTCVRISGRIASTMRSMNERELKRDHPRIHERICADRDTSMAPYQQLSTDCSAWACDGRIVTASRSGTWTEYVYRVYDHGAIVTTSTLPYDLWRTNRGCPNSWIHPCDIGNGRVVACSRSMSRRWRKWYGVDRGCTYVWIAYNCVRACVDITGILPRGMRTIPTTHWIPHRLRRIYDGTRECMAEYFAEPCNFIVGATRTRARTRMRPRTRRRYRHICVWNTKGQKLEHTMTRWRIRADIGWCGDAFNEIAFIDM